MMTAQEIVRLIREGELRLARRELRQYRKYYPVARKAYGRLNNLINGSVDDISKSISGLVAMLWHADFTGYQSIPLVSEKYRGWHISSRGRNRGYALYYGISWCDSKYIKSKKTIELVLVYMLENKHENPYYNEKATIDWMHLNKYSRYVDQAKKEAV